MADIFISYSKSESEITRSLALDLESQGFTVWWDTNLRAGEVFDEKIVTELDGSQAAVVIWTLNSIKSEWVKWEANRARELNKLIQARVPQLSVNSVPPPFGGRHMIVIDQRQELLYALDQLSVRRSRATDSNNDDDLVRSQWERIRQTNRLDELLFFEEHFKSSRYSLLARARRDDLMFAAASAAGTLDGFANYLSAFPGGRHAPIARERASEISYLVAAEAGTIEAYMTHISAWPGGIWERNARDRIAHEKYFSSVLDEAVKTACAATRTSGESHDVVDELLSSLIEHRDRQRWTAEAERRLQSENDRIEWKSATKENTYFSFSQYLKLHPNGMHRDEAIKATEQIAWDHARSEGTAESAHRYLTNHPSGRFVMPAREIIDNENWRVAQSIDTDEAYANYLNQNPGGAHRDAARVAPDVRDWKTAKSKRSREAFQQYLLRHPHGQSALEAAGFIDQEDWQAAQSADTDEAYAEYLRCHPAGRNHDAAKIAPDLRDWEIARKAKTREAFQLYLNRHPNGKFAIDAQQLIDHEDWCAAQSNDTDESYSQYLALHPAGMHIEAAKMAPDNRDWREASEIGTIEAYRLYLHRQPTGVHREKADGYAWNIVKNKVSIQAFEYYLELFPFSPFAEEARSQIGKISFDEAFSVGTASAMRDFISRFPQSILVSAAEQRVNYLNNLDRINNKQPMQIEQRRRLRWWPW